jgi:quercetin dioxygenase-like cupin family protein
MADVSKDDKSGRNPAGEMIAIRLDDEIARAKAQPPWSSGDRFAASLVKHRDLTVTVLLLRKGARLNEHTARGSISLQVIAGAVRFRAAGDEKTLAAGMLCVLEREVPHAVEALEESTLLLTAALPG